MYRPRRVIGDQPDIDRDVSGASVGQLRHFDLIRPVGDDAPMMHGDVSTTVGGQKRRH
jgi:hypothetical protein